MSHWELPTEPSPTGRPRWAIPALLIGVACSVGVAWISAEYFAGQASGDPPSLAFAYMNPQIPFLLLGVPVMLTGALGFARPWVSRRAAGRSGVELVLVAGVIVAVMAWWILALQGPDLLF